MSDIATASMKPFGTTRSTAPDAVSYGQVERAARDLMKLGDRPTVRSVIKAMGKGSPNVVADCLRRFWKETAALGSGDPLALMRLPPELADAALAQWAQALRFAQQSVRHDDSEARSRLEELQREADVRVRSIELREKEWDMAARVRDTALSDARSQLTHLLREQSRDRATIREKESRIASLEAELAAQRAHIDRLFRTSATSRLRMSSKRPAVVRKKKGAEPRKRAKRIAKKPGKRKR